MGIPDATHKASADAVVALGSYVAVFTGDAGTTGANETSGGSYSRKLCTFATGSMSGGLWVRAGSQVNVPVAAGTYVQAGLLSASTSGTFVASDNFAGGSVTVAGTGASIDITPSVSA